MYKKFVCSIFSYCADALKTQFLHSTLTVVTVYFAFAMFDVSVYTGVNAVQPSEFEFIYSKGNCNNRNQETIETEFQHWLLAINILSSWTANINSISILWTVDCVHCSKNGILENFEENQQNIGQ